MEKTYIHIEIAAIISNVTGYSFEYPVTGEWISIESSRYQWIKIAKSNPLKLSAFLLNTLKDDIELSDDYREKKGIYIKPARILDILGIPDDSGNLSAKISDRLRQRIAMSTVSDIKETKDIAMVYNTDHANCGTVGNSCMICKGEWMRLYEDMGSRIAYIERNGQLFGRALVHSVNTGKEVIPVLDRIYYDCDDTLHQFLAYAKKKGYFVKEWQSNNCITFVSPEGETVSGEGWEIDAKGLQERYEAVPYIDTFFTFNEEKKVLFCSDKIEGDTEFRNIDGTDEKYMFTEHKRVCCCCNNNIYGDDAIYHNGEDYCSECFNERFIFCEDCGVYESMDDSHYIESESQYICGYCLRHNYTQCFHCGEYHRENIEEIDGRFICHDCLSENYTECHECGEYIKNEYIEIVGGKGFCSDCAKIYLENKEN